MRAARLAAALLALAGAGPLAAQAPAPPVAAAPTLSLDAQARASVPNDEMIVILAVEREGPQPGPLNEAVLRQLEAALAEARAVDGVKARVGSVFTSPLPRPDGRVQAWRVRGEAVLESTRTQALAGLGGRLAERMQIAGVQFRLSEDRRQAEERRLLADAARAFRTRAADAAAAFGFAGYELGELTVSGGGGGPGPRPMASARGAAEAMAVPIPTDGGESDVVVSVAGKVQLRR